MGLAFAFIGGAPQLALVARGWAAGVGGSLSVSPGATVEGVMEGEVMGDENEVSKEDSIKELKLMKNMFLNYHYRWFSLSTRTD